MNMQYVRLEGRNFAADDLSEAPLVQFGAEPPDETAPEGRRLSFGLEVADRANFSRPALSAADEVHA